MDWGYRSAGAWRRVLWSWGEGTDRGRCSSAVGIKCCRRGEGHCWGEASRNKPVSLPAFPLPSHVATGESSRNPGGKGELLSPGLVLAAQGRAEARGLEAQGHSYSPAQPTPLSLSVRAHPIVHVCGLVLNRVCAWQGAAIFWTNEGALALERGDTKAQESPYPDP